MIYVMSRSQVVAHADKFTDCALISISGTLRDYTNIVPVELFEDYVEIVFDDVTAEGVAPDTPIHRKGWESDSCVPFSIEHATKIVEFAEKHIEQGNDIVVHCDAGFSRSVAVGKFLAEHYGLRVRQLAIETDEYANLHVYETLKKV